MAATRSLPRDNASEIAKTISSLASRFIETVREWRRRSHSRRELLTLDERDLSDVRLTRCDAAREANKPFWRE
jgi:uncharacterized protein YjiS (DUF1127 family)